MSRALTVLSWTILGFGVLGAVLEMAGVIGNGASIFIVRVCAAVGAIMAVLIIRGAR